MRNKKSRLIRIGNIFVKDAIGFFWKDNVKMYIAMSKKDIDTFKQYGYSKAEFHPMEELENAYRNSSALKFISWCSGGIIVHDGAHQTTFDYDTQKIVVITK